MKFIHILDPNCPLCNSDTETLEHLLFFCPFVVLCWMKSFWQINIRNYAHMGGIKWLCILLDEHNLFPLNFDDKQKMLHFCCSLI